MNFLAKAILRIVYSSDVQENSYFNPVILSYPAFLKIEAYSFRNLYEGMRPKKRDLSEPGLGRAKEQGCA